MHETLILGTAVDIPPRHTVAADGASRILSAEKGVHPFGADSAFQLIDPERVRLDGEDARRVTDFVRESRQAGYLNGHSPILEVLKNERAFV